MIFLKKMQVANAISIISLGPSLLAIIGILFVVSNINEKSTQAELSLDIVKLASLFDAVAHTHAVE
ncbi:hypothetical protein [Glaciecola sp. SC05]|uniref:hypothetical protein n=1 Tax=Glaciecola sp. SC05 TaxID=1987355 RepID=UPI003526CD7B